MNDIIDIEIIKFADRISGKHKVFSKLNSPMKAYETVYGNVPDTFLPAKTPYQKQISWNNIEVDPHLDPQWLEQINAIPGIVVVSTCEGHDSNRLAYVVFKVLKSKGKDFETNLIDKLSRTPGIFVKQFEDSIVVAGKTWYGQPDWQTFWESLNDKISSAVGDFNI